MLLEDEFFVEDAEEGRIVRKKVNPDAVFLEEAKRRYLESFYEYGIRKGDKIGWESCEDAVILPVKGGSGINRGGSGVLDREGNYVAASGMRMGCLGWYPCEPIGKSNRKAAYCGCDYRHWGHFLVNVVPRLWVALEMDELIEEYVIVREFHSGDLSLLANQIAFFRLLGILDKIRVIAEPVRYREVIVPEASYWPGKLTGGRGIYYEELLKIYGYVAEKALAESEGLWDRKKWEKVKKVFFSRPRSEMDAGIEVVDSFCVNNGYHIVYAEQISLIELIYYLHHCESIAYLSGTLQHNMLFAPGGRETLVLERRLLLALFQKDIDLMKDISATYVNVQYSVITTIASGTYAYTFELQEYSRKLQMNPPDYEYTTVGFLQESVLCSLRNFIWREDWTKRVRNHRALYYLDALSEDVSHIVKYLPAIGEMEFPEQEEPAYWKRWWSDLLLRFHIPYRLWDEEDQKTLIRTFSSMIERNLESGKREFLIFPYSRNGMLFEDVLRRRYGIRPKAIFDNGLAKYHPEIKKLEEMEGYLGEGTCVVLTSLLPACRKELERYCDIREIESPFSIV